MKARRLGWTLSVVAMLTACGGGGGGTSGSTGGGATGGTPPPPPPSTAVGCSLRERQDWAAAQLREWYLFPETLPATLDPAPYSTVSDYIDALTATARAQGRDRFFTFLTSIAQENAFNNSGATAGFGIRLGIDSTNRRLFVIESFEGAPALAAGIDRGTEIVAIGTTSANLRTVSDIIAASGGQGVTDALGPNTPGTSRVLRITDASGTREVTLTKANFDLTPVSSRYGARIINDGGRQVGYVNLRTFILSADSSLRSAFASFRAAGIGEVIVDMRYNGGGLISVAETLGDLLGGNRAPSDVFDFVTFRPEKAANNSTHFFTPQPQSVAGMKLAFIGTGGTASASELVINAFTPFLHKNSGLIGTNTFGKPVGQIAVDRAECDDRFRIIAFALENATHNGKYFNGLASSVEASCQAADDLFHPMGDPAEASTRSALDFIEGKTCTPITGTITTQSVSTPAARRDLLQPARPNAMQEQVPGAF